MHSSDVVVKSLLLALSLLFTQVSCAIQQFNKSDSIGEFEIGGIHSRAKRDTSSSSTCELGQDLKDILTSKTVSHTFTGDPNQSISLTWAGTNVIVLTTEGNYVTGKPSKLYISKDRGKTFTEITGLIGEVTIRKTSGVLSSPLNNKKIILVAMDTLFQRGGTSIFISEDGGETFSKVVLNFQCDILSIQFSPFHENKILLKSRESSLYVSEDFGRTWTWVNDNVNTAQWDPRDADTYYYSFDPSGKQEDGSMRNELYRIGKNGESTLIAKDVHSFVLKDEFLLLSVQFCGKNGSRVLYVSRNQGHAWNAAQVPMIGKDEFYSLLDMSEEMIIMHVDKPGDTGHGDIYTSDERGIVYDKSLVRHLYPNGQGIHDFYKVESMDGTYITSQLSEDNTVHTVITHDKGGEWTKINPPKTKETCPPSEKECKLQIHNYFSASKLVNLPAFPLSSNNTVGLILAHGNVGDALSIQTPDVYISRDGGYEWNQPDELVGTHFYGIGDSGGVIFAIPHSKAAINTIKYSLDEGRCWHTHNFSSEGVIVTGLLAEPGHQAKDVTIWGYDPKLSGNPWTVFFIDFKAVMRKACVNSDYEKWDAHDGGCVLGSKRSYMRRKQDTSCWNDHQLDVKASHKRCECRQAQDYMCDFGYSRKTTDGECTLDDPNENMDICINGEEKVVSQKYRKIPGDRCTGGKIAQIPPKLIAKNCEVFNYTGDGDPRKFPTCYNNDMSSATTASTTSHVGLIVFLVLLIVVLGAALGVVVYYKRYSLTRVQYRRLNTDNLLVVDDDDMVEAGDSQREAKQNGRLVGSSSSLGGDISIQSPGNLPAPAGANDGYVNGSDLGRPNAGPRSYHDDSDDDLLMM